MNRAVLTLALIGALCSTIVGVSEADAAVNVYMKIDGVNGEANNPSSGEPGWMQLDSLQWGISAPSGSSAARESSAPSVSEVTVTKLMDSTSTVIMKQLCCGEDKEVKIEFASTNSDGVIHFYKILLEDAKISSYNMNTEETASEELSFVYTKITWEYENSIGQQDSFEISKKPGHR